MIQYVDSRLFGLGIHHVIGSRYREQPRPGRARGDMEAWPPARPSKEATILLVNPPERDMTKQMSLGSELEVGILPDRHSIVK